MGALFWFSDAQWAVVQPHLPKNQPGLAGSTIDG